MVLDETMDAHISVIVSMGYIRPVRILALDPDENSSLADISASPDTTPDARLGEPYWYISPDMG